MAVNWCLRIINTLVCACGCSSPARFFLSLPLNILRFLMARSHRQKSRRATARAQSPKNLFASILLSPEQQSRVRSEHVSKEIGGVLAPQFISERFLVGLSFRKQTTPFSWTAPATCLALILSIGTRFSACFLRPLSLSGVKRM